MDPETYRASYTEPLGSPRRGPSEDGGEVTGAPVPQLPEEAYYSGQRPQLRSDHLTLDLLTADELLAILEEAGAGSRDIVTGSALRTWLAEKDLLIADLKRRLAELDRRTVGALGELAAIRGGRSWRIYRTGQPIFHQIGRGLNAGARLVRRLARRRS